MKYSVRKLELSDIKDLSEIMKAAFSNEPWHEVWDEKLCFERLSLFCNIPSSINFTLIDENNRICGAAIGYVVPFIDGYEYSFQDFFINPSLSKNHLGTFFLNEVLNELKKTHISSIKFYTAGTLDYFYSNFGFKRTKDEYLMEMKVK